MQFGIPIQKSGSVNLCHALVLVKLWAFEADRTRTQLCRLAVLPSAYAGHAPTAHSRLTLEHAFPKFLE